MSGGWSFSENVIARVSSASLQALLIFFLARQTSIEHFGAYGVGLSVGTVASGILGFGLPTRVLRARQGDGVGRAAEHLAAISGAVVGVTGSIAALCLLPGVPMVAVAVGTALYNETLASVYQAVAFGNERARRASLLMINRRIWQVLSVAFAIEVIGESHPADVIYGALAFGSLVAVIGGRVMVGSLLKEEALGVRPLISSSKPYWFAGIWAMMQQLDVSIVGSTLGAAAAGAFSAAFRLASPVHVLTTLITSRLIPAVSSARAAGSKSPSRRFLIIGCAYALSISCTSPMLAWLAVQVLGPSYESSYWVIAILFCNSGVSVVNQVVTALIFAENRVQRLVAPATAFSSILGLVLVWLGAVAGNVEYAALGTLSIQLLLMIMLTVGINRRS